MIRIPAFVTVFALTVLSGTVAKAGPLTAREEKVQIKAARSLFDKGRKLEAFAGTIYQGPGNGLGGATLQLR